jgi:tetratricopeptide (TPR) repeat protein
LEKTMRLLFSVWSLLVVTAGLAPGVSAQLSEADAAFQRGDYRTARAQYEQVVARDSGNVAAQYRLAILDGWEGRYARSLERYLVLRRLAPLDGDIMTSQAQLLVWMERTAAARALYDSVLARWPDRADALAGRARTVARSGDLTRAEELWRDALARHPDDPELLIGLAQVLYWRGEPVLAAPYVARARALAPEDRTARELERALHAILRPAFEMLSDGGGDSDGNDNFAVTGVLGMPLGPALRGTLLAGWRRATLGDSAGTSYGVHARGIATLGRTLLRAGVGLRRLDPDVGAATTPLTAELGVSTKLGRYASGGVGYSRMPFDETAFMISRGLVVDAAEAGIAVSPSHWSISCTGEGAWVSDGNRRYSGVIAVLARVLPPLEIGPYARVMGYRQAGDGYFAPDRFTVLEARTVYSVRHERWGVRLDGGAGTQQVMRDAAHQLEWHVGFTSTWAWGLNSQVSLEGALTNSAAAASTTAVPTEAFRYGGLKLRFKQGF